MLSFWGIINDQTPLKVTEPDKVMDPIHVAHIGGEGGNHPGLDGDAEHDAAVAADAAHAEAEASDETAPASAVVEPPQDEPVEDAEAAAEEDAEEHAAEKGKKQMLMYGNVEKPEENFSWKWANPNDPPCTEGASGACAFQVIQMLTSWVCGTNPST